MESSEPRIRSARGDSTLSFDYTGGSATTAPLIYPLTEGGSRMPLEALDLPADIGTFDLDIAKDAFQAHALLAEPGHNR